MGIERSCIVRSTAGRDKGKNFIVLDIIEGKFALLVDGKVRKLEKPKRKKIKHLVFLGKNETRLGEKILSGEKFTNAEVRRTLAEKENNNNTVGGNELG